MRCIACDGVRGVQAYDFIGYKKILHGTGYTIETHTFSGEACLNCIEKLRESRLGTFQRVLRIMPPLVFATATVGLAFAIGPASESSAWSNHDLWRHEHVHDFFSVGVRQRHASIRVQCRTREIVPPDIGISVPRHVRGVSPVGQVDEVAAQVVVGRE